MKELNALDCRRGRKPLDINNVIYWFKNTRAAVKRAEMKSRHLQDSLNLQSPSQGPQQPHWPWFVPGSTPTFSNPYDLDSSSGKSSNPDFSLLLRAAENNNKSEMMTSGSPPGLTQAASSVTSLSPVSNADADDDDNGDGSEKKEGDAPVSPKPMTSSMGQFPSSFLYAAAAANPLLSHMYMSQYVNPFMPHQVFNAATCRTHETMASPF